MQKKKSVWREKNNNKMVPWKLKGWKQLIYTTCNEKILTNPGIMLPWRPIFSGASFYSFLYIHVQKILTSVAHCCDFVMQFTAAASGEPEAFLYKRLYKTSSRHGSTQTEWLDVINQYKYEITERMSPFKNCGPLAFSCWDYITTACTLTNSAGPEVETIQSYLFS
jgi:hypothetical protein